MTTEARKCQGRRWGWSERNSGVLLSNALEGREDLKVAKGRQMIRLGSMAGNVMVNRNFYQRVGTWG